jgi:hypothetical protein
MRAAAGQARDFAAVGDALNGNTMDLAAAVDSLFGPAAARSFQSLWADHVDGLMAYTTAVTRGDTAGQGRAQEGLRSFERSLATFLSTATGSRLGATALSEAFLMHDRMLLEELEAFRAENYERSHDLGYRAYEEMFGLAGQLSNAIGATVAQQRPRGGSQTGGGGMASVLGGG